MMKKRIPCTCGEMIETEVCPDNWYVLQHLVKGKLLHWKYGFYKEE